jgi:hypothetical protein
MEVLGRKNAGWKPFEASGICSAWGDGGVMKILAAILIFAVIAPVAVAQEAYAELAKRFEYGAGTPPLAIKEEGVLDRGGIKIHDISYASPVSGRVPAYLVAPASKGRFAAILWGTLDDAGLAVGESRRILGGSHRAGASRRRVADD